MSDCKHFRQQIEELDLGEKLNPSTMNHLGECSSCREFFEDESKLRQIVAGLAPVEAPADFEIRLRRKLLVEPRASRRGLVQARWSFALPALAVAASVLLVGSIFFLRNNNSSRLPVSNASIPNAPSAVGQANPALTSSAVNSVAVNSTNRVPGNTNAVTKAPVKRELRTLAVASRVETKDSSSVGATVVKRDASVTSAQFPLSFPFQTLKVSIDDSSGVSRTISFPSVSFGSQRVLMRQGSSFQSSPKSDW